MDLGLSGRVALVTGASRGLGRACALAFAHEGAKVAVAARSGEGLRQLADEINAGPGEALVIGLDLTQQASIDSVVPRVVEHWGALHILVANAPGPPPGAVIDISVDEWQRAIDVNVLAMVRLTKATLPVMKAQGDGRINYITTIGVRTAQPAMVLSNSTRLAIVGLAKTLSLEVARDGILVNVFAPGPIATDRMDELITQTMERNQTGRSEAESKWLEEVPMGRMGEPHDLASVVALLSSPRCSFTTGAVISVDGGKSRAY